MPSNLSLETIKELSPLLVEEYTLLLKKLNKIKESQAEGR